MTERPAHSPLARSSKWAKANPEKHREQGRRWRKNNAEKHKAMAKVYRKRARAKHGDKLNERRRKWGQDNKERMKHYDRARRIQRYGITLKDYERLVAQQKFRCEICEMPEKEDIYGVLRVDHCHKTGKVRGLLCNGCNRALGMVKDKPEVLISAAAYLRRHQ